MMFSCRTFLLKRRRAFSTVSPSCSITSAKCHLQPAPILRTVTDYVVFSYYCLERRKLPPINRHCQEKNRFFKESVHIWDNGGTLSVLIGPKSRESPLTGDGWRDL